MSEAHVIYVTDQDGLRHRLPALEGWRVMEIIRDAGLSIKAECGGACCCATCHVYVKENWISALPPANEEEEDMLDEAVGVDERRSRLSCQLIYSADLNGLEVFLAPGTRD